MDSEDCTGRHNRNRPFPQPTACEQCDSMNLRLDWIKSMMRDSEELAYVCDDCLHAHRQADADDCEGC